MEKSSYDLKMTKSTLFVNIDSDRCLFIYLNCVRCVSWSTHFGWKLSMLLDLRFVWNPSTGTVPFAREMKTKGIRPKNSWIRHNPSLMAIRPKLWHFSFVFTVIECDQKWHEAHTIQLIKPLTMSCLINLPRIKPTWFKESWREPKNPVLGTFTA